MAAITDPFILPEDVTLLPVTDLAEEVRDTLTFEEGDIAIQRLRSRTPSKVISRDTADLLEQFREASTIAEAVVRFSSSRALDAHQVLQESIPILQQFINARWLVAAGQEAAASITAGIQRGDRLGRYTIVTSLQVLEDTEIYQARSPSGEDVALKVVRPDRRLHAAALLAQEADILRVLDGKVNPQLLAEEEEEGRPYLALSWCPGVPATVAAAEGRSLEGRETLLDLCLAIIRAFAHLHHQGVVHGDVHPNNVLVDTRGDVHLLDFGLARRPAAETDRRQQKARGGVAFFFEPEYARAILAGQRPPPASAAGEQYALAALTYHLLSGVHYLNFTPEQEKMLQQIAEEPPLSFASHRLAPWPEVEDVLARALAKQPEARFADLAAFAAALAAAGEHARGKTPTGPVTEVKRLKTLLDDVMERLDWESPLLNDGVAVAPSASVNYGAAGIAYFLYRVAGTRGDARLLALADAWLARSAAEAAADRDRAFFNETIEITAETVGAISPYHTESGLHLVDALISGARGDQASQIQAVRSYIAAADAPQGNDHIDLTLGWSGVLLGAALLYESLDRKEIARENNLEELGAKAMNRVWQTVAGYPAIAEAAEACPFLGVAHGWAGFLYATLRWAAAAGQSLPPAAGERLAQLANCMELFGRGARWPWRVGVEGTMPGWCNGTAGFVYLWPLAGQVTGDDNYWRLAELAAWNTWEDPALMPTLCCGLAGRAYALLHWHRHTADDRWLKRARVLAERAAEAVRESLDEQHKPYANSLYKGEVGVAALIADLEDPGRAALPLFEGEGFPA